jgi:hypothetical protein
VSGQFFLTTQESERNYFTGERGPEPTPCARPQLPPGDYRVVDGALVRIVPGIPPWMRFIPRPAGDEKREGEG